MSRTSQAEHGTVARYKKHKRDKEEACRPCKDANNAFELSPEALAAEHKRKRAVSRATTRLKNTFRAEFEVFYQDELRKEDACVARRARLETPEPPRMDTTTPDVLVDGDSLTTS